MDATRTIRSVPSIVRVVHPAPTIAVVALSGALAAILRQQAGLAVPDLRVVLTVTAVFGSQVFTGALNDWADRHRDAIAQPSKPIASGRVHPRAALTLAMFGLMVQVAASIPLGGTAFLLGLVASGSAAAYNLWLSRTPWSVLPYLVSFGLLPAWVAAGVAVPLERVLAACLLVGPFAAAAHLANTIRDFDVDEAVGSRNLAQTLGRRWGFRLAWALAMAVGLTVGIAFAADGRLDPLVGVLGIIGLAAVIQGIASPTRLWAGMLVAAVAWTAGWAFGSG